jgi:peptide/nickel transport system ATP-binding protein
MPILSVRNLTVDFPTHDGVVHAVDDVSFDLADSETLGIVGESGSGKSVTAMAILGLLPTSARITGEIEFDGQNLVGKSEKFLERVRGQQIAMIFQDALAALNPVQRVGHQIAEAITVHSSPTKDELRDRVLELLDLVGIPNPSERAKQYPHEYSGGMRQRAMIAMAIANDPDVLIADEPTTALDVTIQAQVLDVLERIQERTKSSILLITHDLGVVAGIADRVLVMYAGRQVEIGDVDQTFYDPRHPYTRGLLGSLPRLDRSGRGRLTRIEGQPPSMVFLPSGCAFHPRCVYADLDGVCVTERPEMHTVGDDHTSACHFAATLDSRTPRDTVEAARTHAARATSATGADGLVLEVKDLVKEFPVRSGWFGSGKATVKAVSGLSFGIERGKTLGLVGESGCGKTTTGRLVLQLTDVTSGSVQFRGEELATKKAGELRALRGKIQIVFQDPYASLNPRMSVRSIISEPLRIHHVERGNELVRAKELMALVGLNPEHANRFPHEFSGGQRQRIGIARALALEPDLLVLDEPVSALDVSIQAGIVNLLEDLQDELGLAYLFIAHDLSVVRHICDDVAVMYLGKIVEMGPRDNVYDRPMHPYTQALLSAVPVPDPRQEKRRSRIILEGDVPSPVFPPSGCRFRTRCWKAQAICATEEPALIDRGGGHPVACHFAEVRTDVAITAKPA